MRTRRQASEQLAALEAITRHYRICQLSLEKIFSHPIDREVDDAASFAKLLTLKQDVYRELRKAGLLE